MTRRTQQIQAARTVACMLGQHATNSACTHAAGQPSAPDLSPGHHTPKHCPAPGQKQQQLPHACNAAGPSPLWHQIQARGQQLPARKGLGSRARPTHGRDAPTANHPQQACRSLCHQARSAAHGVTPAHARWHGQRLSCCPLAGGAVVDALLWVIILSIIGARGGAHVQVGSILKPERHKGRGGGGLGGGWVEGEAGGGAW